MLQGYKKLSYQTTLPKDTILLDIECVKEKASDGIAPNRFRTYMIGFVYSNGKEAWAVQIASNEEQRLLDEFSRLLKEGKIKNIFYYAGLRDFDRDVLAGVWTNARSKMADRPRATYPWFDWTGYNVVNLRKHWGDLSTMRLVERGGDFNGKKCMTLWTKFGQIGQEQCFRHNLLDLTEMNIAYELKGAQ